MSREDVEPPREQYIEASGIDTRIVQATKLVEGLNKYDLAIFDAWYMTRKNERAAKRPNNMFGWLERSGS
jgi:hypothetical protein